MLRWAGDPEGGAPFVEADPDRPGRAGRLRRRDRRPHRARPRPHAAVRARHVLVASTSRSRAATPTSALSGIEDTPARRAAMAVTVPYYEFREVLARPRRRRRALPHARRPCAARRVGDARRHDRLRNPARAPSASTASRPSPTTTTCTRTRTWCSAVLDAVLLDNVLAERRQTHDHLGSRIQPESVAAGPLRRRARRRERAAARRRQRDPARARCATARSSGSSASGTSGTTTSRRSTRGCSRGEPIEPVQRPRRRRSARRRRGWEAARALPAVAPARVARHHRPVVPVDGAGRGARRAHRQRPRLRNAAADAGAAHRLCRADARHAAPAAAVRPLLRHRRRGPACRRSWRRCSASR